jgi:virulence factor Mce-like protein
MRGLLIRIEHWSDQLDHRPSVLMGAGTVMLALIAGVFVLIFAVFGGDFSNYAAVTVVLPPSATAVSPDSPVEYLDVQVGTVAGEGHAAGGGLVAVPVHLDRSKLKAIPVGVVALVQPTSIFGNQYIVLQPPSAGAGSEPTLRSGATILAAGVGHTNSVQETVGDLDRILIELHPAELDGALTAMAQAIAGQGQSLGATLDSASGYLATMQPLWPTMVVDLQRLTPFADALSAAVPDLLGTLAHFSTTGSALSTNASEVKGLITNGAALAGNSATLLTEVQQPFAVLMAASGPMLQDISANPQEIAQLLSGLDGFARAIVSAESNGPYLQATATVDVLNPANLALGALGGPDMLSELAAGLGSKLVDPPTYTAADCPQLGGLSNCGGPAASATTADDTGADRPAKSGTVVPVLDPAVEDAAVSAVATAATGRAPGSAAVASLLLSPVLESIGATS